jgi:hypothetical protein
MFLDDLVAPENIGGPDLTKMLTLSLYDLCSDERIIKLRNILHRTFQSSLAQCAIPPLDDPRDPRGEISYVKMLKELLEQSTFVDLVADSILACLHERYALMYPC